MTQQQLNGTYVGPGFHQMGCKTVEGNGVLNEAATRSP